MINLAYRSIVVLDLVLATIVMLSLEEAEQGDLATAAPDVLLMVGLISLIAIVMYFVGAIGLLMLKSWGYFIYIAVSVILIVIGLMFSIPLVGSGSLAEILGLINSAFILIPPLVHRGLRKEFFG